MRLVRSSEVGAIERDRAIRLLTERGTMTRMVCRELLDGDIQAVDRRSRIALSLLLRWISENQSEHVRFEPRPQDGLEQMMVPEGFEGLMLEIEVGAQVCDSFFMLLTADNRLQAADDRARIHARLAAYWERHHRAAPVLASME
jgi:hypothetical protein